MKKCPFCAEVIEKSVNTCPHCREKLHNSEDKTKEEKIPKASPIAYMNIYQRIVLVLGGGILLLAGLEMNSGIGTAISILGATVLIFLAFKSNSK